MTDSRGNGVGGGGHGDDRPSRAVLDELLAMFHADDLTRGADIDLDSPEVEELLSGGVHRPDVALAADDDEAVAVNEAVAVDEDELSSDVIVIADDDLPDAAYLDESIDDAGPADTSRPERGRVFIDDDSKLAEVVGSAEAERATGIEPKLRERRDAVRKARRRHRLRWVLVVFFVLVLVVAGLAVLGSSLFSVKDVDVSNAVYSRDELAPIIEDMTGEPTLRLDTNAFEQRIEAIPWVEDARVDTRFPDSASIEIRERSPTAAFQGADGDYRVIDPEGRVLDLVAAEPAEYLLVRSPEPPDTPRGDFAPRGFIGAASMARALTPSVAPLVELVQVANDGSDLRLQLTGGTEVLLGSVDEIADKLVRLETVIDDRTEGLPARIDVSTDDVTTSG